MQSIVASVLIVCLRGTPVRPSNFGKSNAAAQSLPSLIVAGAIYDGNEISVYADSTNDLPHMYAPGIGMKPANGDPGKSSYVAFSQGTSDGEHRDASKTVTRFQANQYL